MSFKVSRLISMHASPLCCVHENFPQRCIIHSIFFTTFFTRITFFPKRHKLPRNHDNRASENKFVGQSSRNTRQVQRAKEINSISFAVNHWGKLNWWSALDTENYSHFKLSSMTRNQYLSIETTKNTHYLWGCFEPLIQYLLHTQGNMSLSAISPVGGANHQAIRLFIVGWHRRA